MPAERSPTNRRERPAKPALTRKGIVDAALEILREEGLARVTMRRIAAVLDTGPASLYVYVQNTEDLHAQILDALLEPATAAAPAGGSWRDRLRALLVGYRDVLFSHPEIAHMALSTRPNGPNYVALVEAILALLVEGGATDRAAAWGVDLLMLYPTAVAAEHSTSTPAEFTAELTELSGRIDAIDPARHPTIARLGPELFSGTQTGRFDWAFDVLLAGILAGPSAEELP